MNFRPAKCWAVSALVFTLGLVGLVPLSAHAADQHITPTSSLQNALNALQSGDTLYLGPGDYYPPVTQAPYNHLLVDGKNGTASGYITVRNEVGQARPRIHLGGAIPNGFAIRNGSYFRVDGVEIIGGIASDNGTNGFFISNMHHFQIVNCVVRDMGASGISTGPVSQTLFENNICFGNCKKANYGPSGISIYHPATLSSDNSNFAGALGNPNNNYSIIVRNNTCYDNIELVPDAGSGQIIDGNGIIIDDFNLTQGGGTPFSGKTLVVNNVCYNNGGKGIHVFISDNVDVFNNTLYKNQRNVSGGELDNYGSNNCFFNNVVYANNKVGSVFGNGTNVQWEKNLYFNTTARVSGVGDIVGQDPLFVAPGTDGSANFHLQAGSPAINVGKSIPLTYDRDSVTRTAPEDLGAYEASGAITQVNALNATSETGFAVSNTDLINNGQASFSSRSDNGYTPYNGSSTANLNDGAAGSASNITTVAFDLDGTWTTTFTLNTSTNTAGYDVSEIRSYAGWTGLRLNQKFGLSYTTVSNSTPVSLGTFSYTPGSQGGGASSKMTLTRSGGGNLASGVKTLIFSFQTPSGSGSETTYREIDAFGTPTAGAPVVVTQTNALSTASQTAFAVSSTDLINTGQSTFSTRSDSGYTPSSGSSTANLNDGSAGITNTITTVAFDLDGTWTTTFTLNTATNTAGYDISEIRSFAGWPDARINQKYELLYTTVSNSTPVSLGTFTYAPGSQGTDASSRIILTRSGGGNLASGVKSLIFAFQSPGAGSETTYREIDAFGTATSGGSGAKLVLKGKSSANGV